MVKVFSEKMLPSLAPEAAALAPVVLFDTYETLFRAFTNAVVAGTADGQIMDPRTCTLFVSVLQLSIAKSQLRLVHPAPFDMQLGTVLASIRSRLAQSVEQAEVATQYQLVTTLSNGVSRESLHKPLLDFLEKLSKHREIRLAQAATYARESLRCIPDSDGPYRVIFNNIVKVVGAASKIAGAVTTLDLSKLFDGVIALGKVPELTSSMIEMFYLYRKPPTTSRASQRAWEANGSPRAGMWLLAIQRC